MSEVSAYVPDLQETLTHELVLTGSSVLFLIRGPTFMLGWDRVLSWRFLCKPSDGHPRLSETGFIFPLKSAKMNV